MSFLARLFGGGRDGAERAVDKVWLDDAARMRGLCRDAVRLSADGRSVLVVALAPASLDALHAALAPLAPLRAGDVFERDAPRRHLERPGAVAVALPGALPTDAPLAGDVPLEMLVCGRNERRRADAAIAGAADVLSADARVTFHVALDDALLRPFAAPIAPLLDRLGASPDEPVEHPLVARSIARAQARNG